MTQSNAGGTNYQVQTGEYNTIFYGGEHTHNYPPTPDEIVGVPQNLPFSGTAKFVGRDEVLKQVRSELMAGSRLAITAIQGMGGIGKTELALQYALKFSEEYPGGICWLRARQEIATQIIGFGQSRLNLQVPDWLDDAHKQVAWCWQHWRSGKVLLIVDDVVDYGKVKEWLPQNDARFQVLMTTRETLGAGVIRLELSVLSDGAALELLESLIGEERSIAEKSGAIALCQWVGNLPLGLELIGRYLAKKEDLTLAEMLQRLQKKRLSSPAIDKVSQEMNAQLGVRDAFELSWAELDTAAKELAVFLSLFASSPISWQWVIDGLTTYDSEEIENARDDGLRFLHLLQRIGQGEYQLHPLVREFFGEKLQNDRSAKDVSQLQRSFAQVMTEIAKTIDSTGRIAMLDKVRSAIPHIAEVTKYVMLLEEENDQIWSFTGLAWFYQGQRLWQEAEEWSANCLRFVKDHFGDRHPHTATSLNNLALLYSSTGQYTRALPLHESALEIRQSELGNQHPHTAQSLNNLADLYVSLGQYDLALFLFESALEIRKTELGNRHPDVAASLNNLAYLYKLMGAYDQALPLYKSALKIYQLELGDLHPDTTKSLNNLAGLYYSMEQYNCARAISF